MKIPVHSHSHTTRARSQGYRAHRSGFTLVESMIAIGVGSLVVAAVMATFLWAARQANLCAKIAWSQNQAMRTSTKLESYLRNASAVTAIDQVQGTWVQVRFPDGSTGRFVYSNAVTALRDGRLYLVVSNGTQTLVSRGLTEIMDSRGFNIPIFTMTRTNALRIAFRVAEPTPQGTRAANDSSYAASVRFGVCMRNVTP